jgi:hypothetical protein
VSDEITAKFYGNRVKITHDGPDGFGSVFVTDDEAEKLRIALYAVTKQAREREAERRAEAAKPKTVRVRIAVAIDDCGDYQATAAREGGRVMDAKSAAEDFLFGASNDDPRPFHVVFVEADVPLPVTPTVEGSVSEVSRGG